MSCDSSQKSNSFPVFILLENTTLNGNANRILMNKIAFKFVFIDGFNTTTWRYPLMVSTVTEK